MNSEQSRKTARGLRMGAIALGAATVMGLAVAPGLTPIARGEMVWLNINVETRASAEGQRSWAVATTTSDKAGKSPVKVRKLHIVLDAHEHQQQECEECDALRIDEYHEGAEVMKARAQAWSEGPAIRAVEAAAEATQE